MSIGDFDLLTIDEFESILEQWRKEQSRKEAAWLAGIRLHAAICIQPHCRGNIRPSDLFKIPDIDGTDTEEYHAPELTPEERRAQYEALKQASGFK